MKIEFDVPNFEKELEINIVIRKDGEVVYKQATPPSPETIEEKPKKIAKKSAGNLMNSDMF